MTKREFKRKYWYPISVEIEFQRRKFRRWVNRLYRRYWGLVFILVLSPYFGYAAYQMYRDYSLIHNYANLDFMNSDFYTKWNTDGKPGQDPPK